MCPARVPDDYYIVQQSNIVGSAEPSSSLTLLQLGFTIKSPGGAASLSEIPAQHKTPPPWFFRHSAHFNYSRQHTRFMLASARELLKRCIPKLR